MRTARRVAFGIVAGAGLLATACWQHAPQPRPRVLLVGIDGAAHRVVDWLRAEGRLPHLDELAREGVSGTIRSHFPLWSPRIWNSVATGKEPEQHGILGFVHEHRLYTSRDRRAHALWNIASDAGLRVAVVNWWNSFPPERIHGVMVSDYALPGVRRDRALAWKAHERRDATPRVYPPQWEERAEAMIAEDRVPVDFADPFEDASSFPPWVKTEKLENAFLDDARVTRLALAIEQEIHPHVMMLLLVGIDRVSHWLWGNLEPAGVYPERLRPSAAERRAGAVALLSYYAYTDALLGELLARYGPDDLVVVLSDHGFESGVLYEHLTGTHESERAVEGVFFARGPGLPAGAAARGAGDFLSVNDVTPTILAWLGLPVGEDMQGRPMPAALRTPLRTVPTHDTAAVERLGGEDAATEEEILEQLRELGYLE